MSAPEAPSAASDSSAPSSAYNPTWCGNCNAELPLSKLIVEQIPTINAFFDESQLEQEVPHLSGGILETSKRTQISVTTALADVFEMPSRHAMGECKAIFRVFGVEEEGSSLVLCKHCAVLLSGIHRQMQQFLGRCGEDSEVADRLRELESLTHLRANRLADIDDVMNSSTSSSVVEEFGDDDGDLEPEDDLMEKDDEDDSSNWSDTPPKIEYYGNIHSDESVKEEEEEQHETWIEDEKEEKEDPTWDDLKWIHNPKKEKAFSQNGLGPKKFDVDADPNWMIPGGEAQALTPNADGRFACDLCPNTYSLKKSLVRHRRSHLKAPEFKCNKCNRVFNRKDNFQKHMNTFHKALKAAAVFGKRSHHKMKIRAQPSRSSKVRKCDPYSHKCSICGKSFKWQIQYTNHLLSHGVEYPFRCSVCDRGFKHRKSLVAHLKKIHRNAPETMESKPLQIAAVVKPFDKTKRMELCKNSDNGRNETGFLECPVEDCSTTFVNRSNVIRHVRNVHSIVDYVFK